VTAERQDLFVHLREVFAFLGRGALFALVVAGVAGPGVYAWTARQPTLFRAESTLLVARSTAGFSQFGLSSVTAPPIDLAAYQVAARSDVVLLDALRALGVAEPTVGEARSLRTSVDTTAEPGVRDSSLLRVEALGSTRSLAAARADALAQALVAWDQRRATDSVGRVIATLEQQIAALGDQLRALQAQPGAGAAAPSEAVAQIDGLVRLRAEQQQQLGYARALVASAEGALSILQAADANVVKVAPRPALSTAVAVVLAIALAYGLLLIRRVLNTRLDGSSEIAQATGLPVLAEFRTYARDDEASLREAAGYLRTNLLFATQEATQRVLMVTSAGEGEGKSTVARSLAESFVRFGYRTLLVDADLRAPSLADHYDVGDVPGAKATTTEAWLRDGSSRHGVLSIALGGEGRLDLIPQFGGVADAAELLGRSFRPALAHWAEYDVIVVDTAPVLAVSDALSLAPNATGTILVVDRKRADRRRLAVALAALRRVDARLLGVVANNVGDPDTGSGYGYGSPYAPLKPDARGLPAVRLRPERRMLKSARRP